MFLKKAAYSEEPKQVKNKSLNKPNLKKRLGAACARCVACCSKSISNHYCLRFELILSGITFGLAVVCLISFCCGCSEDSWHIIKVSSMSLVAYGRGSLSSVANWHVNQTLSCPVGGTWVGISSVGSLMVQMMCEESIWFLYTRRCAVLRMALSGQI